MTKLYALDFFAWTQDQADALRRRSVNEIDWENLLEEVESLGRQERSELRSHLIILLTHLLKWRYQPERRSRSWALTVAEQRIEALRVLRENPSLKRQIADLLSDAYETARIKAARETRRPKATFPPESPFDWDLAMTEPVEWDD